MIDNLLHHIRETLKGNADDKTKASFKRFFREEVKFYGVKSAVSKELTREVWSLINRWPKAEIFTLCEKLYQSGMCEEQWLAASLMEKTAPQFAQTDLPRFKDWIDKYMTNWASIDTFCNHSVGALVDAYPTLVGEVQKWANSSNRWLRRASAVSLIIPAKEGKFLKEIFAIADILLLDPDDLVQKGYGWLLKEASRLHQSEVFAYVMKHKHTMPRTALRYALEKMPVSLRQQAMSKT